MLGTKDIVAFVPSRNPTKARAFYEEILGLRFVSEDPFALVLDANGVMIRVANVSNVDGFKPAPFTILGWLVDNITASVKGLNKRCEIRAVPRNGTGSAWCLELAERGENRLVQGSPRQRALIDREVAG